MRYFRKLTFGVALTFAAGALPNVGLGGEILPPGASPTTTAAYLSAHGGLQTHALFGGAALKTYAIGFPSSGTAGIETSYGPPGYVGSQDITFTASTKAVNDQTISWGTTNGNVNPLQIPALALVGGGFLLDGSGNPEPSPNTNPNLSVVSNNGGSMFGYTGATNTSTVNPFGANGTWNSGVGAYIAVNNSLNDPNYGSGYSDSIFLYFSKPVAGFAALFNYNPADAADTPSVTAYDKNLTTTGASGSDTVTLAGFNAPGSTNKGFIYGFLDSTADIQIIQISDGFAAMAQLVVTYGDASTVAAVPEPITIALLGSGLLGLGLARRRRAK